MGLFSTRSGSGGVGYKTRKVTRRSRVTRRGQDGSRGISELVTVASPSIPKAPWMSGPLLYGTGLFLHYVWLHGVWERLGFSLFFAMAGSCIGFFAASYGRARTSFQRMHAAATPPLFSLILSVPLCAGWGRYSSLVMLTYWIVLSGGWMARVARSVWGDGSDAHGTSASAAVGEMLNLPGMASHSIPGEVVPSMSTQMPEAQGLRKASRRLRAVRERAEEVEESPSPVPESTPEGGTGDEDSSLVESPYVVHRRITVTGTQGYEDIVKQLPGLQNMANAYSAVARRVPDNRQAADVTLVLRDMLAVMEAYPGPSEPNGSLSSFVTIGVREDGTYQRFPLMTKIGSWRGIICGASGSGKSGALLLLIAELSNRGEFTIWMIDTAKSGQTTWAFADMIDWLADSEETAMDMLSSLDEIISARSAFLGQKRQWTPGCGLSRLIVVVDEFADVATSSRSVMQMFTRLSEQARSVGIAVISMLQKPSADNMPTGMRANLPCRLVFPMTDKEARKMALSSRTLAAGADPCDFDLETEFGKFFYEGPGVPPADWAVRGRTYALEPEELAVLVEKGAPFRTGLDKVSTQAAGVAYRSRRGQAGVTTPSPTRPLRETKTAVLDETVDVALLAQNDSGVIPLPREGSSPLHDDPEAVEGVVVETRTRDEVLEAVLQQISGEVIPTSKLRTTWESETQMSIREMYRALTDSPDVRPGARGFWERTSVHDL